MAVVKNHIPIYYLVPWRLDIPPGVISKIVRFNGCEIADKLAMAFGGGGHIYAAGFKVEADNINFDDLKNKVIAEATRLIDSK